MTWLFSIPRAARHHLQFACESFPGGVGLKRWKGLVLALLAICTVWADSARLHGAVTEEESLRAYRSSPFATFSQDYFARFSRDPEARVAADEVALEADWQVMIGSGSSPLATLMGQHLVEFLADRMNLKLALRQQRPGEAAPTHSIVLLDQGGGRPEIADSFSLRVSGHQVIVQGQSPQGLRDGVVRLVDQIGFRSAPILELREQVFTPRQKVRLGAVPWMGSYRDVAFHGGNAVILTAGVDTRKTSYTELIPLSTSQAIPELAAFQDQKRLDRLAQNARAAKQYGLKTYIALYMWRAYPADAAIFTNHPGLRGAKIDRTDQASQGFIPCTEHPLMQQYLTESLRGLFRQVPLDGAHVIIGGEVFQHCFMRPVGVKKGHTTCERCEGLGAETVVANLCNLLADAIRSVNPDATLIAWPYTATQFWSADGDQRDFIKKFKPGTALMTEMEKEESLIKDGGGREGNITKLIWDYSIDYIGPTPRAIRQIALCRQLGLEVYLKSEPELAFEAPGLPYIPCLDRWYDRAEAMANTGATGSWVFPWFQASYGTTSSEVYKYAWWSPGEGKDVVLSKLARRIAGPAAAPNLQEAWRWVSQAITNSPELPPYFCGPYFLGPAHPMCADATAELPEIFQAKSRFGPHVLTGPTCTPLQASRNYRRMEQCLSNAVHFLDVAEPLVPKRSSLTFRAEALPARWFYHIARTHANFYESCLLRDYLTEFATREKPSAAEVAEARLKYRRWRSVLTDERANTVAAIPVVEQDSRLDVRYGFGGAALEPAPKMMRAKLELLDSELNQYLPTVAKRRRLEDSQ